MTTAHTEPLTSAKVLIVDDSQTVRDVIAKTLAIFGFEEETLYQAANGQEALKILNEQEVGLIFSDINMPVMSGVEMITHMQSHDALKRIPVVVITTDGSFARMSQMQREGAVAYLRKPFTPEEVRMVVTEILGREDAGN